MWVVFAHPLDYPGLFVARRVEILAGRDRKTDDVLTAFTLEALRDRLVDEVGCSCPIPRSPQDDPVIVETWI